MSIAETAAAEIDVEVELDDFSDKSSDSGRGLIIGVEFSEHDSFKESLLIVKSISEVDDGVGDPFLLPLVKSSESLSSKESLRSFVCNLNNSMDGFKLTLSRNGFMDGIPELPGNNILRYLSNSSASSDCWCSKLNMRAGSMAADEL